MRNYQRTTDRGNFSRVQMQSAVTEVLDGAPCRRVARQYDLSYKTLRRYVTLHKQNGNLDNVQLGYASIGRRVFSQEEEEKLLEVMLEASRIFYGLTLSDLRTVAFEFAAENGIKTPPKWQQDEMAGEDWLSSFRARHGDKVYTRPSEVVLSFSRRPVRPVDDSNVTEFLKNLRRVVGEKGFTPDRIWNADETTCGVVVRKKPRGGKGGASANYVLCEDGEGKKTVTFCAAINAVGSVAAPFLVFPREDVDKDGGWKSDGAPPGTVCRGHPKASGRMTRENFVEFIDHFKSQAKPTRERPVLLILDNHASHCNSTVVTFCKKNHITLVSFPPNSATDMQPLHGLVFVSFNKQYFLALDRWAEAPENAGKHMAIDAIPSIIGDVFAQSFTSSNIIAGFKATGIYPMDPPPTIPSSSSPPSTTATTTSNSLILTNTSPPPSTSTSHDDNDNKTQTPTQIVSNSNENTNNSNANSNPDPPTPTTTASATSQTACKASTKDTSSSSSSQAERHSLAASEGSSSKEHRASSSSEQAGVGMFGDSDNGASRKRKASNNNNTATTRVFKPSPEKRPCTSASVDSDAY